MVSSDNITESLRRWRKLRLALVPRIGAIVLLLWLGWTSIAAMQSLVAPTPQLSSVSDVINVGLPSVDASPWSTTSAGHWTFADWNWRIGRREIAEAGLHGELTTQLKRDVKTVGNLAQSERKLIEILRRISTNVERSGAGDIYKYESPDARLHVRVQSVGEESRLFGAALALRMEGGRWQVWELLPAPAAAGMEQERMPTHLLPFDSGATQLAARWSDADELLLEVVSLSGTTSAYELLSDWRQAGWRVAPLTTPAAPSFHFLCTRGDTNIVVWSPERGPRPGSLIATKLEQLPPAQSSIAQASQ